MNQIKVWPHKIHGNNTRAITFPKQKKGYSIDTIQQKILNYQTLLKKKGHKGEISVNILLPSKKQNPGHWTYLTPFQDIDYEIYIPEIDEDYFGKKWVDVDTNNIMQFQIVLTQFSGNKSKFGKGNDKDSNCFYKCLLDTVPFKILHKVFPTPESLKKWLGVKENDGISIDHISKIEEKLTDYSINIVGDYDHISIKKALYTLTFKLYNSHYTVERHGGNFVKGIIYEDAKPLIYRYTSNPDVVEVYDGEKKYEMKYDLFVQIKNSPGYNNVLRGYIPVKIMNKDIIIQTKPVKITRKITIEESYEQFVKDATILKEKTEGKYNLFQTGSFVKAAVRRFYEINRYVKADPIDELEAKWIKEASISSLMYAKKGYKGEGYQFDVNSEYSTIMSNQKFSFPVSKGIFKTLTKEEFNSSPFYEYGIYRCNVRGINPKLMKNNPNNKYTHFDLTRFEELGYQIELIEDGQPNLLSYSGKNMRINGDKAFGQFVEELYKLKKYDIANKSLYKTLLVVVWGALCENVKWKSTTSVDKPVDVPHANIKSCVPLNEEQTHFLLTAEVMKYNTNFGRLGPFLLSRGRCMISRIVEPHIDSIVRIHTDGFISSKNIDFNKTNNYKIDSVKIGLGLGNLKYEGYCEKIHVVNVNTVLGVDGEKAEFSTL